MNDDRYIITKTKSDVNCKRPFCYITVSKDALLITRRGGENEKDNACTIYIYILHTNFCSG